MEVGAAEAMPSQSRSGFHGDPWYRCNRCGCDYPTSKLVRQKGLILCKGCTDNPASWDRDAQIANVIENAPDEMQVAEILKDTTGDEDDESTAYS
jgi:hypothetical protein